MRKFIAEFIGTMVLVFVGCGAAVVTEGIEGTLGILGISFAFGLALMAMIYAIGNVSGCHINPAVSLAMLIDGRIWVGEFFMYLVAQILGAFAGTGLVALISEQSLNLGVLHTGLGANGYGDTSYAGTSMIGALVTEIVLTFIFLLVILNVTANEKMGSVAGIVIGLTLTAVHIIGIPLTGTSVNPARSLAPAVIYGLMTDPSNIAQVWVFIVGPFIGAALAAIVYKLVAKEQE